MSSGAHKTTPRDGEPPRDELDAMLRAWHDENAERARAGRDRLVAALKEAGGAGATGAGPESNGHLGARQDAEPTPVIHVIRRVVMNRYSPAVAALIAVAVMLPFMMPRSLPVVGKTAGEAFAASPQVMMAPEGGRLDALDAEGNVMGPCALSHTDVDVDVSGLFTRVTINQTYTNPYADKIEAVYTFPMSERAAVDRMTMTIGDRVVIGEVKEREKARRIYEAARASGHVASLLEQERPNIFTQSVANIEPGAVIDIEISYVELLERRDGEFSFTFPTVVAPRYIPGGSMADPHPVPLPEGFDDRDGLTLLAPCNVENIEGAPPKGLTPEALAATLASAQPIEAPIEKIQSGALGEAVLTFDATYPDGAVDRCGVYRGGVCRVDRRWCLIPRWPAPGEPFSPPTSQVPDADRITPMPVKPGECAGHDISIQVTIDTGGPGLTFAKAPLHDVNRTDLITRGDGLATRARFTLAGGETIPNRDFALTWRQTDDAVEEAVLTHAGDLGNFFCVTLMPPKRVEEGAAVPRELIFVLDTSGSMSGAPMETARKVMDQAIASMRPRDTFNLITFAGRTSVLWETPRPATPANIREARDVLAGKHSGGGTEMMTAINTALEQKFERGAFERMTLEDLADTVADGRRVRVGVAFALLRDARINRGDEFLTIDVRDGVSIDIAGYIPPEGAGPGDELVLDGAWSIRNGRRTLSCFDVKKAEAAPVRPLRLVMLLTDGHVGNDLAILDAIRRNRGTTRVFSFGIGNSVNRYLLSGAAEVGGGAAEYVLIPHGVGDRSNSPEAWSNINTVVDRFSKRTTTPVLTNIKVEFSNGLAVTDLLPESANQGLFPDLFDHEPLHILGRYAQPGTGEVTITGQTGNGAWSRTIKLNLPEAQPEHDTVATVWARKKVDAMLADHLREVQNGTLGAAVRGEVVRLGETFSILTAYTSFVAVDRLRVTMGGEPRLVRIPIEFPDAMDWEGVFGIDGIVAPNGEMVKAIEVDAVAATEEAAPELRKRAETRGFAGPVGKTAVGRDAQLGVPASAPARPAESFAFRLNESIAGEPAFRQQLGRADLDDARRSGGGQSPFQELSDVVELEEGAQVGDGLASTSEREGGSIQIDPRDLAYCRIADTDEAFSSILDLEIPELAAPEDESTETAEERLRRLIELNAVIGKVLRILDSRFAPILFENAEEPSAELDVDDDGVLVSVLFDTTAEGVVKALETEGLTIATGDDGVGLVIGRIDPANLVGLALVEGVRRIEPTTFDRSLRK